MRHLTADALTEYFYRDHAAPETVREHLAGCERCSAEYEALETALSLVGELRVPERSETYPEELWARLSPRLERPRFRAWAWAFSGRPLSLATAVALLVVVAFLAGRWDGGRSATTEVSASARERILLLAVGSHLERSRRTLLDIANAEGAAGFDLTAQQGRVEELLHDNRLYKTTARQGGNPRIADLLDELDRVFLEIANSPPRLESSDFNNLRRRIGRRGLLTRIRILGHEALRKSKLSDAPEPRDRA